MSEAVFDTPLVGCSLVEASAGTGKTFALAGLFVRAVIERGLQPRQILAVTFTTAATQELRARIRLRLEQAAVMAAAWQPGDPETQAGDDAATATLRRLLHAAIARGESPLALRLRVARAARDLDLAQIATIHGFCQRVLAEQALDAGQALGETGIETALAPGRSLLATRLWREHAGDADGAAFLRRRFGDVDGLRKALDDLLSHEALAPGVPDVDVDAALRTAWNTMRAAFLAHGSATRRSIEEAVAGKILSRAHDKTPPLAALWDWLGGQTDSVPPALPRDLEKLGPRWLTAIALKGRENEVPRSLLSHAVDALLQAFEARDLAWLHRLRANAHARDAERKAALQLLGYDDLIGALHAAVSDDATRERLRNALQARIRLALVDEFQDTDARQWEIFRALFAGAPDIGLVLVGDPKQAIYRFRGGDVRTYVGARGDVQRGDIRLRRNHRSRPVLVSALNTLWRSPPADALGAGIAYEPVEAGERVTDADLQRDGMPVPPLAFHAVPPRIDDGKPKDHGKDASIDLASRLCADAIRERLAQARAGRLLRRDGERMRAVEPRDCAVLVRTHAEATAVRNALSRRRVPAATVDRGSLYASEEARELLVLLLALLHGGDDARMRAALATPLFGLDAEALADLCADGSALQARRIAFDGLRARWQRHGPQAMLAQVVAAQSTQMLACEGGERRIANLLQLGELLQEAAARSLGLQGQVDWLQAAIAHPDNEDEAQLPRLESDADRVQIMTLHASKGLEFPLVFLPFAGIGRDPRLGSPRVAVHHVDGVRVRQWRSDFPHPPGPAWSEALKAHRDEDAAEDMRLLYVGLTRAREALWLCGGALYANAQTALHRLLDGNAPSAPLQEALGAAIEVSAGEPAEAALRLAPPPHAPVPPARVATRTLRRDWWVHSFSQLHRQAPQGLDALVEEAPADDERDELPPPVVVDPRYAGPRFGNVLHHALEHADFAAWRDRDGLPESEREGLLRAFAAFGYRADEALAGLAHLAPLVSATLHAGVPAGAGDAPFRLCDLDRRARIDEMEFHFALRGSEVDALVALLHAHGVLRGRRGFGGWRTLSGLMTGKIDLTCRVDGRFYVIDYKTNALPAFDADSIAQAIADSEYDWQALLYAVALQRWLRSRLGADYDFDRHVGGVRYLFCRGLDPAVPGRGVHVMPFTRALVDAVDALLAAPWPELAA